MEFLKKVVSENGPRFLLLLFAQFAKDFHFSHVMSSPRYTQANGEAEKAMQTFKVLLNHLDDPYMALLAYNTEARL